MADEQKKKNSVEMYIWKIGFNKHVLIMSCTHTTTCFKSHYLMTFACISLTWPTVSSPTATWLLNVFYSCNYSTCFESHTPDFVFGSPTGPWHWYCNHSTTYWKSHAINLWSLTSKIRDRCSMTLQRVNRLTGKFILVYRSLFCFSFNTSCWLRQIY